MDPCHTGQNPFCKDMNIRNGTRNNFFGKIDILEQAIVDGCNFYICSASPFIFMPLLWA